MIYNLYSVQDTLIGFNAPFIMANDEIAVREYRTFLGKNAHPEDMRLYKIGLFNDENGTIEHIAPVQIQGGGKEK